MPNFLIKNQTCLEGAKFILAPCQMLGDWKEAEQDGIALVRLQIFLHIYHHEYSSLLFSPPVHQISSLASLSCLLGNPEQSRAPREVPKAERMSGK